jgi:hypothetical protein
LEKRGNKDEMGQWKQILIQIDSRDISIPTTILGREQKHGDI